MFGNYCGFIWCNLCVILFYGFVSGQVAQQLENKLLCIEKEECGPCLAAAAHCRWCADPYYRAQAPRCNDDQSLVAAGCSQDLIQRPEAAVWEVVENQTLQDMQPGYQPDRVVQIQPQRVKLSLKPRESQTVKFTYRPARNYPLDLYYLMDLTWSMRDDKETLVSLRDDLPVMLKNLTDNFRLGFGSFADKPVMPYASMEPKRRANPCVVNGRLYNCEPTYSYHHQLSLTSQVSDFIEYVNRSSVTGNRDDAEAQLDALVQAVSCGDRIGWDAKSRKIVLLLSDGLMHTAGDGILGGATRRNDESCHLDERGYHSQADIYDYPSVAQVYRLLDRFKVNVIFAVTQNVKDKYDSLHKLLEDFTYVAKLESDSSNILKLVKTGYDDVVSVVRFEDDSETGPVRVKYFSDCGVKGGPLIAANRCTGVEFGMTLNFEARLTLDACPEYKKSRQIIKISESQLGQDSLMLEVDIHCGCRCQEETARENVTVTCGPNKNLMCGVCLCNKGWQGPNCDCSIEDEAASAALIAQCRDPNAIHSMVCSGAGDCLCGSCHCDRSFSGRYCQCRDCEINPFPVMYCLCPEPYNNLAPDSSIKICDNRLDDNGLECGGMGHGACVCGLCECEAGWSGDACDCTDSKDSCVAPGDEDICSGRGDCRCGRCECSPFGDVKYMGAFCESCATCENPLCATTAPCVTCHLNSSCTELCNIGGANYTVAERLDDRVPENDAATTCILRQDEDGQECEYKYTYTAGVQAMVAMEIVIRSKECYQPTSAKIMTSALVIFSCVIAAGLIVILGVKSAQVVADRRAYAKFAKEVEESRKNALQMNPLYISPISEFKMPEAYPRDKFD